MQIIRRGSGSVVTWRRAQMVLLSVQGIVAVIARVAFTSEDRVRDVIRNFNADGFASLYPIQRRPSAEVHLGQRREITPWSLAKMAEFLVAEWVVEDISHEGLRVLLRQEGVTFLAPHATARSAWLCR